MADAKTWQKIKKEYIRGGISLRGLADKYGVSFTVLGRKCRDEGWVNLRQQAEDKAATKTVENISDRAAEADTGVFDAALDLLGLFKKSVQAVQGDDGAIPPSMLKDYGSALKSIQSCLERPTLLDIEEQKARIEKLRADTAGDKNDNDIKIVLQGDLMEWSE